MIDGLPTFHFFQDAEDDGSREKILIGHRLGMAKHRNQVRQAFLMIRNVCQAIETLVDMAQMSSGKRKDGVQEDGACPCSLRHKGLE